MGNTASSELGKIELSPVDNFVEPFNIGSLSGDLLALSSYILGIGLAVGIFNNLYQKFFPENLAKSKK